MEKLKINTSQNIEIEHTIASIGERIAASIFDILFISGFLILITILVSILSWRGLWVIALVPVGLYDLISELTMNGQTWGKQIMKIKVVKIDGTPTSFTSYFLRWIIRLVEITAFFGSLATISIILSKKGQRIGDMAADTTVIRISKKNTKSGIYIQLPEGYQPVFGQVMQLNINDIYTVKEVLDMLETSLDENTAEMGLKARYAIEQKLGIKSDLTLRHFFQTILQDYNYYSTQNSNQLQY